MSFILSVDETVCCFFNLSRKTLILNFWLLHLKPFVIVIFKSRDGSCHSHLILSEGAEDFSHEEMVDVCENG